MGIGMCDNKIVDKAALAVNNPNQIVMEPCNVLKHTPEKSEMNLERARKAQAANKGIDRV
jgi:hypothetical protein